MAKMTQFGRMRRRIKRELDAARTKRVITYIKMENMIANTIRLMQVTQAATVTTKMLAAWKKEQTGELKDLPEPKYTAIPVRGVSYVQPVVDLINRDIAIMADDPEERMS